MDINFTLDSSLTIQWFRKLALCFALCFLCSLGLNAQLYTRTTFNSAYIPISTGGGATISTATGNDANQTGISLGFTFAYAGNNYTTLGLNTNGFLFFDALAPAANTENGRLFSTLAPNLCVTAWWNDLIDDASSDILYQTQGAPGSRTFTLQYTNYPSSPGTNGSNVRLNYQVILYETSNVIEYHYGVVSIVGTIGTHPGAAIGLEYGAGGKGNFIDAVTGSKGTTNRMLSAVTSWPAVNYRFTPGSPAPIAGGTYNVGVGQTYSNLSLAVADLNHRGIVGPVTLNLTDANYDTTVANGSNRFPILLGPVTGSSSVNRITLSKSGTPATISYRGSNAIGFIGSFGSAGIFGWTEEPILGLSTTYATISNINLFSHGTAPNLVDVGLLVFQSDAMLGAQYNLIEKISVNLDRANTNTIGISSKITTGTSGVVGSNSHNTYRDFTIRDCNRGMDFEGGGGAGNSPDLNTKIIASACNVFNSIGDPAVPNDIGGTSSLSYGIRMHNQTNPVIRNCIIRNVSTTNASSQVDGILMLTFNGVGEISNNVCRTISRSSTGSTSPVCGIRITTSGNTIKSMRVFNNSVSEILSSYTGVANANRYIKGILIEGTGNGGKQSVYVWNNSVSINGASSPNLSNTCFEISNPANVNHVVKNNVFANFTPVQTGVARHYCFVTPVVDRISFAASASTSDHNDLYIASDQGVSGHVGLGNTTNYSTLAAWQAGITFNPGTDTNSISSNPFFANNNSDLHGTALSSSINGTGTTPPGYTTLDYDCELRNSPFDIGFDDISNVDTINIVSSFNPSATGSLCGLGYDPDSSHLWIYGCSVGTIQRYSSTGVLLGSVTVAGGAANDVDLEVAPENLTLNTGSISKGQLLLVNGETGVADIFAYSKTTGLVTDTLITSFGNSHVVGGSYHELRNTFFVIQDNVPGVTLENMVAEIHPVTGATLNTFQTTGVFNVSFGDIEVGTNGNLFIVSSAQTGIAEYTPTGTLVKIHNLPAIVNDLSGIALDCNTNQAWVCTNGGVVYQLGQFPCGSIPSVRLDLGLFIEGFVADVNELIPVLANNGISSNSFECDSVTVELRDPTTPYGLVASFQSVVRTDGIASLTLPQTYFGGNFYIAVKGRNIIETWTKVPITLTAFTNYNFK
jgi:hypothetical protein